MTPFKPSDLYSWTSAADSAAIRASNWADSAPRVVSTVITPSTTTDRAKTAV